TGISTILTSSFLLKGCSRLWNSRGHKRLLLTFAYQWTRFGDDLRVADGLRESFAVVRCPGIATLTKRPALAQPFYSKRVNVASSLTCAQGALVIALSGARRARNSAAEMFAGAANRDAQTGEAWFESGASQQATNS